MLKVNTQMAAFFQEINIKDYPEKLINTIIMVYLLNIYISDIVVIISILPFECFQTEAFGIFLDITWDLSYII